MIWVKTFNTHLINDGVSYRATGNFRSLPDAKPVFLAQQHADPVDSGAWTVDVSTISISIKILNYANRQTLEAQLRQWFKRGTVGSLVVTFTDEPKDFFKTCRVVNLVQNSDYPLQWTAILNVGPSTWRAVTADTYDWNLTGTGGAQTITLPANDDMTRLSLSFEASGLPSVGYLYSDLYQLVPPSGVNYGARPWLMTLNTAALIADTSKSNQVNAVGGITNSTLTIPIDTPVGGGLSTGAGLCYVDSEQIRYTSISGGNINVATGGRGVNGTTAATHADNAVIKQSQMQADCHDLRVFLGGVEARRTIISPNNASTRIWIHSVDLGTGYRLTLASALDGTSNYSALQFSINATHQQMIAVMPDEGILVHGTEWISYRGRDAAKCKLLNPTRGILSTTKQAHSVGDAIDHIPTAVKLVWGNIAVGDPASDDIYYDETKPIFNLTSSDNTQWVYDSTTGFYDPLQPNRPGALIQDVKRIGDVSGMYDYTQEGASPDAPAMGMKIAAFLKGTAPQIETATLAWRFFSAGGIQEVSATTKTFRNGSAFPVTAALQYQKLVTQTTVTKVKGKKKTVSVTRPAWFSLWNESSPAAINTWTAGTHNTVSVLNTTQWIQFVLSGSMLALAGAYADFEILTLTVKFTTANIPTGTLLTATSNYQLDVDVSNTYADASGANVTESIAVEYPMKTGKLFDVDGENFTVQYEGTNAHSALTLDDESREVFLNLAAGNNDLVLSGVDVGVLVAHLSYYRRRL